MNDFTNCAAKIVLTGLAVTLLQGCGPGSSSRTLPPACASLGNRGISVPPCFHESREGEACDPQEIARAKEEAKTREVAEAKQAAGGPVASCR